MSHQLERFYHNVFTSVHCRYRRNREPNVLDCIVLQDLFKVFSSFFFYISRKLKDDSFQLSCQNAFRKITPQNHFRNCSKPEL